MDYTNVPDMTQEALEASVNKHIALVAHRLRLAQDELERRADSHDESKTEAEESATFRRWRPRLQAMQAAGVPLSDDTYKDALAQMGEGLKHHYANNSHHPEHYENGVYDMSVFDLIEMVCDWSAAGSEHGQTIDWDYVAKRFNIGPHMLKLLRGVQDVIDVGR